MHLPHYETTFRDALIATVRGCFTIEQVNDLTKSKLHNVMIYSECGGEAWTVSTARLNIPKVSNTINRKNEPRKEELTAATSDLA